MNILRRLPLSRLLLLCGLVAAIGISATALALAVSSGPKPPPKPLAEAVHDALAGVGGHSIQGVSARIQLTDHLLEGANLASGSGGEAGQLSSSPLISGASGRLWIASDGRVRLELQSEKGDTQILYDGHTITLYDAATNTVYRYTPPQHANEGSSSEGASNAGSGEGGSSASGSGADGAGASPSAQHHIPSVQEIQEGISHLTQHATLSTATPDDVAGQPAYTVRISPSHNGGLIGGAELSWDANTGVPLRAAVYASTSAAPVIELAATEISYGAVASSVFEVTPPANAKVEEVKLPGKHDSEPSSETGAGSSAGSQSGSSSQSATGSGENSKPKVTTHGEGLESIINVENPLKPGTKEPTEPSSSELENLPQVKINGTTASELATPLGTLLTFERSGIRYLLAGSVTPATIEAFARGL
jgi:outer membrane lipoprotein-sorting protein